MLPAVAVCGWCKLTSDLDPHNCLGNSDWSSSMQISPILHFQVILQVDLDDLWPWCMSFDHMNIKRFPYYINKPNLVQIWFQLFKWGHFHIFSLSYNLTSDDLWPWYMTFNCMNIWTAHIISINQVWFKSDFNFSNEAIFHIFSLSYNLTSDDLDYELWPHQQMRVPMLHLWPNFGWNPSKHVEDRAKC